MYNTITIDEFPPNPAAPVLVRTSDGHEWHTATTESAEQELNAHIAANRLARAEVVLREALAAYKTALPGCTENMRYESYRRVQAELKDIPSGALPELSYTGPPRSMF